MWGTRPIVDLIFFYSGRPMAIIQTKTAWNLLSRR